MITNRYCKKSEAEISVGVNTPHILYVWHQFPSRISPTNPGRGNILLRAYNINDGFFRRNILSRGDRSMGEPYGTHTGKQDYRELCVPLTDEVNIRLT